MQSDLAPLPRQKIELKALVTLQELVAEASSPDFVCRVSASSVGPTFFELDISARRRLPICDFRFDVRLTPRLTDGSFLPTKVLPATGSIVSDLQACPPFVSFGAKEIGETPVDTVAIRSLTGQDFEILETRVSSPTITVRNLQEIESDGYAFEVRQRITTGGPQSSNVTVHVKTADGKDSKVEIPVNYHGIAPRRP